MLSKRNYQLKNQKASPEQQHFTIKKFTVGVASVLVGTTFGVVIINKQALADELEEPVIETVNEEQALQQDSVTLRANSSENEGEQTTNASASSEAESDFKASETITDTQQTPSGEQTEAVSEALEADRSTPTSTLENTTTSEAKETETTSEVATSVTSEVAQTEAVTPETVTDPVSNNADTENQALSEDNTATAVTFSTRAATLAAEDNTETTVNNWSGLINALNNSQYQTITVNGQINASGTNQIFGNNRTVVIKGSDQNAGILFGSTPIVANGTWNITFENLNLTTMSSAGVIDFNTPSTANTVTFKDVRHSGASLYGGDGSANVVIAGTTTSSVSIASVPTVETYKTNGNDANIWGARSVTIANGANFTLNRSAIGDGINLPDGATVQVGDQATFTLNMNTNNATDNARYHDAGIFMLNGGNFLTGRNANVTLNTSIGQAVSIGANRPGLDITDTDRFGGYTANQSRNDGPTTVTLGEYSTLDFTGRDGFILGNNANFTSGEYSNVHFQNNGRGVALDLANNSNIIISKHSNTLFESKGKTGTAPSGSYDGYNYIGVNEGGNITIDEYATFRVILSGRGKDDWDDVISLDSRLATSTAAFTSKKGAIVDIRDDNTNFYAELISFPLSVSGTNATINIEDPLYLNLQRYSAGGPTTGWMPVGGTAINSTSDEYTANLIYIGGNTGKVVIGGTDYVVYQQIKSDGTQQIWLNINEVTLNKNGFSSLDQMDNGANPDISISGSDLVSGIPADHIKDNQSSPTVGSTTPYYGISTMRASHQIWFPHSTVAELTGSHQNVIRYVYEDGSPVLDAAGNPLVVTQSADLIRDLELSITTERIQDIQNYAATHTADETLQYIRDTYTISKDSGWKVTDTTNTQTTYDAVISPVLEGYVATIQQTNAGGVTVGSNADSVQANLALDPNAALSDADFKAAYTSNVTGTLGIPENYETIVVYKKELQDQTVTIIYQDKTDNNKVLATEEKTGKPGESLDYSTAETIKSFTDKGYKLVSDGVPTNATFGDAPVTYYVILEHDIAPVGPNDPHDPDTPINPNDPDGPKWPSSDNYTKTYTSTVEFVDEQGNKLPNIPDDVQTSTWTRTLNVDKVTGEILNPDEAWTPDKTTYDKVTSPVVPGYYADVPEVAEKPTVPENITDRVVYRPLGKVIPVDPEGNPIPNAPTPQYPNDPTDPTKGGETPIPEVPGYHPQDPNTPTVTPTDPGKDTPVVYVKDEEAKYSLVEKFVDENGTELAPTVTKGTEYVEGTAYDVTGDAKVISGYYLKAVPTNAQGTFGKEDVTVTFVYAPLGKVIPVDPEGNPIPDAPTPQYPNDPNDPTKGGETPIPEVPGYHPQDPNTPTVTPTDPGKDTPVVYVKDEEAKYSLVEKFVDENGTELAPTVTKGTEYVEGTAYDVTGDAKVISGYYLKAVPTNAQGTFGKEDVTVTFVYAPLGKVIPVDPEGNPIPDAPTPQYPNDPNDPTKGGETPIPEVPGYHPQDPNTPTVTPTDPGKDTPVVYVKDEEAKYSLVEKFVDENGTELAPTVTKGTEYVEGTAYDVTSDAKVISGYYLKTVPTNAQGTFGKEDVTVTFVYAPLGKVIPVDPEGNPIPDAPTPQYPNDPNDPTKGGETPVPNIPGMTPEVPSVIPTDPGTDTKVVYVVDDQKATINYIDETKGQLITSESVTGKSNTKIDYTTANKIKELLDKGYVLVNDGFPSEAMYDNDKNIDQFYTVILKHDIAPVGPNDPHEPGTPINPNDPDGPKWPAEEQYRKEYTSTIEFVDENGNKVAESNIQTSTWTRTLQIDKVTGEILNPDEAWTADKDKYTEVISPVVTGYYADKVKVPAKDTVQSDLIERVVYRPLGKVTPVDPEGNPIPDAPAPQYPNDPNDPTKGGETPIPEVPGYHPQDPNTPTVTPTEPGKDTPIIYIKDEEKYSLVEKFVDENGTELAPTVTKGTEYVEGTAYDVTGDAKVISGYYLKAVPANAQGTFGKENVTVTFVYAPLGKVIPVDPNGDPIPNVPTPQYPNDPNDPTKGGETPVPEIPGYKPEKPTVTPDRPGEDTKVIYVPIVPEKHEQNAKIVYIDEQTGTTLVTDEVKGQAETKIDYSTDKRIQEFTDKGYVVIENGFVNAGTPHFDNDDSVDQVYVIKLGHGTAPVGPNDPHEPGTPINPNDPNGPKWPAKDEYTKQYTSTVHFVDENGNKLRDDDVQTSTWTRTLIVDKVTGKVLNPNEAWRSDKNDYVEVRVPVIKGYYADRAVVPGAKTEQRDLETTVVYKKIGKIIPVDPAGVPLPNVPTPQYQNDPNDPTKVIVTNVPEIPGLTPEVLSVDPSDPGKDTPVIYTRPEKPVVKTVEPESPVKETPVVAKAPLAKESPVKVVNDSPTGLPQTGEKQNNSFMAALGSLFIASMLGLVGGTKKKKGGK